ncbi:MAG TPA: Crp/Fnr family transcriptional regulator [Armatimonadota bacterium]|nr:Crp/Fnr family transcriptional regulator [Armatimonadota bacterium]
MPMTVAELKQIPFLATVPDAELEDWGPAATKREAARRETLVSAGEAVQSLFLVTRGMVMLCLESKSGETRMTGLVDSTQCFNIQCLHPKAHATESAHSLTDSEVVEIPAKLAREALRRGGVLAILLAGYAAGRLAEVTDDYVRATTLDVRARTAVSLLRLSDRLNTSNIPLTQEQLSGLVGTRRETLALILGALRGEEIIDTRYRMIKILDRERLLEATRGGYPTCVDSAVPVPVTAESILAP